jgi:hypothetical protein
VVTRDVQFKYGDTWQNVYRIGERIRWGGNDLGEPADYVIVTGVGDVCPVCGFDPDPELLYEIAVRDGVIEGVTLSADRALRTREYLIVER